MRSKSGDLRFRQSQIGDFQCSCSQATWRFRLIADKFDVLRLEAARQNEPNLTDTPPAFWRSVEEEEPSGAGHLVGGGQVLQCPVRARRFDPVLRPKDMAMQLRRHGLSIAHGGGVGVCLPRRKLQRVLFWRPARGPQILCLVRRKFGVQAPCRFTKETSARDLPLHHHTAKTSIRIARAGIEAVTGRAAAPRYSRFFVFVAAGVEVTQLEVSCHESGL